MKKNTVLFIICALLMATSCEKSALKQEFSLPEKGKIDSLIDIVSLINSQSPENLSAGLLVIGTSNNKKFKSTGELAFTGSGEHIYLAIFDFIFKSPITMIFKEGETLSFYYPGDKKIVVDTINTMEPADYGYINIDFYFIYDILRGKIPLIKEYKIKQAITEQEGGRSFVILENDSFYETISFDKSTPDRVLLMDRKSKKKFEFYLTMDFKEKNSHYFKKITIVSANPDIELEIHVERTKLNEPVFIKTTENVKIPADTKVFKKN